MKRARATQAAATLLTLMAAYLLKRAYSTAGADALGFVLAPSAALATWLGGPSFAFEEGAGYISHTPRIVVGPSCAGVNFMIVAWLSAYFSGAARFLGASRIAWALACGVLGYLSTLLVNGMRIALAARLFDTDIYTDVVTKPRVHLALGVVLYCGTLLLGSWLIQRVTAPSVGRGRSLLARLSPLYWYLGVVLLVPIVNRAWAAQPERFLEHALLTLGLCAATAGLGCLVGSLVDRVFSRRPT